MKTTLRSLFVTLALLAGQLLTAQIATNPELPVATKPVTITFDSSLELRLGIFTGELYAHTGVIVEGKSDWQHVIGDWANNNNQPKLTHKGGGIFELVISPDINTFYSTAAGEKVLKMAFVFRSANWNSDKKQTNDLFVNVYEEGLVISLSSPADGAILDRNTPFTLTATASMSASLTLKTGASLIAETTGKTISGQHTFTESGWQWIVAQASSVEKTVTDSNRVFVKEPVTLQTLPPGYRKGVNYIGDHSAALVLWAPFKNNVFVVGDFNDWDLQNSYQMKKDGDYFWLEVTGLDKGRPYVFQYHIDGQLRIADPYTHETSGPDDQYLSSATFPGLAVYPTDKASGVASVIRTGQEPYNWEVPSFNPPAKENLVIYELLVRDFTSEHTFLSVVDKLDYLKTLGINALELMPVNEFEGNESWGYNPSFYFAPDKYYGTGNGLKKLVDEAHRRGMAVIIDMVLNHSYGQSPLVQMYLDRSSWRPTAENPWYNQQHNFQNTSAQWGYDFNHESVYTRQLIDSINSFWMQEYKVDGFRFDFTKGFSNTPYGANDWGSAYDAPRIANLKRMATEIWKRNDRAYVIFEHLSDNSEEKELAAYGILLWGNMSGAYGEAAKGNNADLSGGLASSRGWDHPRLVTYMESHDEERVVVKCLKEGFTAGNYNIRLLPTALDRVELNSLFLLPLPGPKMIWQFGELGYDYSINTCSNPSQVSNDCRLTPKPVLWNYVNNTNRYDLYKKMARLNFLKTTYEEFSSPESFTGSLGGEVKWYRLGSGSRYAIAVGNFATSSRSATLVFPVTGTWNDYFPGTDYVVNTLSQSITLAPGEFRLFTTHPLADPFSGTFTPPGITAEAAINLYPNPARNQVTVTSGKPFDRILIRNITGQLVYEHDCSSKTNIEIPLGKMPAGLYFIQLHAETDWITRKLFVY